MTTAIRYDRELRLEIRTVYDPPPIPNREFDWSAVLEDSYEPDRRSQGTA
jgi:hypothetical protein